MRLSIGTKALMNKTALWEALHTRGHDAAHLATLPDGWRLMGSAVYLTDEKAVAVNYSLDLNSDWSTRCGSFHGFVGGECVNCQIVRDERGWTLNGVRQRGLEGAVDLDLGFTPATNYPQLQRMALKVGQTAQITVAWMDVRSDILEPLSQIYCRVSERSYDYHSPRDSYRATLDIALARGRLALKGAFKSRSTGTMPPGASRFPPQVAGGDGGCRTLEGKTARSVPELPQSIPQPDLLKASLADAWGIEHSL